MHPLYFCTQIQNRISGIYRFHKCPVNFQNVIIARSNFLSFSFNFRTSSSLFITIENGYHRELENEIAHHVLEKNPIYDKTLFRNPLSTRLPELVKNPSIYDAFAKISTENYEKKEKQTIESADFTEMVRSMAEGFPHASDDDILQVLSYLYLWPPVRATYLPNFKLLWNSLDKECSSRVKKWAVPRKLLIADCWYHLRLSRISLYNMTLIKHLIETNNSLSPPELVQVMFYVMLQRSVPQNLISLLEKKIEESIKVLSLEEISIICIGFFKTQNRIFNHNVVKYIISRFNKETDKLDNMSVIRILKFLRKTFHKPLTDHYVPLLKQCTLNLERWNLLAAVNSTMLCSTTFIFEPFLLDCVTEILKQNLEQARIKDIGKIVQCLSQFNYMPTSNFHEMLFEELKKPTRLEEIKNYPRDMMMLMVFYTYMGYFNHHALSFVLNPKFTDACVIDHSKMMLRLFITLDNSIDIECADYEGPRLEQKKLEYFDMKFDSEESQKSTVTEKITNDLFSIASTELFDEKDIVLTNVLPHAYSPDIVFKISAGNNSDSLRDVITKHPKHCILKPAMNETWGCLVIGGPFSFAYKSSQICGIVTMKMRQLKKLGYKVIFIPYKEVPHYKDERKEYLKLKLNSFICNHRLQYLKE